jgi:16S rRNA (guanine966-N2)-methyltransferase
MRVIAGKYRSRVLRPLPGMDIRPTADRLRETLLNVLTAGNPNALEGTTWIDLFAGTGAVGIEAISRGAAKVQFVESSAAAVSVIRQNLKSLGIDSGFEVLQQDAARALPKLRGLPADFVFLDPPYRLDAAYKQTLDLAGRVSTRDREDHNRRRTPQTLRPRRRNREAEAIPEAYPRGRRVEFLPPLTKAELEVRAKSSARATLERGTLAVANRRHPA